MKSLQIRQDRSLCFRELPKPEPPGPGQVLIKMRNASICGYDIMILQGKASRGSDGAIGHEGSGVVEAVGEGVTDLRVGDRVTLAISKACGVCPACRSNRSEYCVNPEAFANFMSEYISVRQEIVYRIPDELSFKEACLTEPLVMAMYAVKKADLRYGKNVILLGCGAMGQIILKLIRRHPVGKIVVVEPDAAKREAALRFGADIVLDPNTENFMGEALMLSEGLGYDAVLEISGSQTSAKNAFHLVARGGSVVYFALYGMDYTLDINLFNLYWKDANICAVGVPSGLFPDALRIAPQLKLEEVITAVYPFEKAIEAFEAKANGGHAKVMLEFADA